MQNDLVLMRKISTGGNIEFSHNCEDILDLSTPEKKLLWAVIARAIRDATGYRRPQSNRIDRDPRARVESPDFFSAREYFYGESRETFFQHCVLVAKSPKAFAFKILRFVDEHRLDKAEAHKNGKKDHCEIAEYMTQYE